MPRKFTNARKKKATKIKTRAYDTVNYLRDELDMVAYLQAALIGGNAEVIAAVVGDIVRGKIQNLTP